MELTSRVDWRRHESWREPTISTAHAPLANDDRAVNQGCRSSSSWVQVHKRAAYLDVFVMYSENYFAFFLLPGECILN